MSLEDIKIVLLKNSMIFIGIIEDDKFIINQKMRDENSCIVVLTQGV